MYVRLYTPINTHTHTTLGVVFGQWLLPIQMPMYRDGQLRVCRYAFYTYIHIYIPVYICTYLIKFAMQLGADFLKKKISTQLHRKFNQIYIIMYT